MIFDEDKKPDLEEVLSHHGIKGMHWGVRRANSGGSSRPNNIRAVITKKSAQGLAVSGAATTGRVLGRYGGTVLGGPIGGQVGGIAGGYIGGKLAGKQIQKRNDAAKQVAIKDKASLLPKRNLKYTDNMVKTDVNRWGPDGAQRINQNMNSGKSRKDAVNDESKLQFKSGVIAYGATLATSAVIRKYGKTTVSSLTKSAGNTARAKTATRNARNTAANTRGLPEALKTTNIKRGVYNITSL